MIIMVVPISTKTPIATVLPMMPIFAPIHPAANQLTVTAAPIHKKIQMAMVLPTITTFAPIHRPVKPSTVTAARPHKVTLRLQ